MEKKIVALSERAMGVYGQERAAKFLATLSDEGVPNVVLVVSQVPVIGEPGVVVFGEFMMVKTLANLRNDPRFASIAITEKLEMAGFRAEVEEWTKMGDYVDVINSIEFFRYNAYAGVHNVAVTRIESLIDLADKVPMLEVGRQFLAVRLRGRLSPGEKAKGVAVPGAIRDKFNSLMSIKVAAYKGEDGWPEVVPVFASLINDSGELRFLVSSYNRRALKIKPGSKIALNVLTLDLITYQVKGELVRFNSSAGVTEGVVKLEEAYSCVPPFCGQRVS